MKSIKRQLAGIATMVAATGSVMIVGTYTEAASAAGCPGAPSWRVGNNVRFNDAFVDDYSPVRVAPDADCARVGTATGGTTSTRTASRRTAWGIGGFTSTTVTPPTTGGSTSTP